MNTRSESAAAPGARILGSSGGRPGFLISLLLGLVCAAAGLWLAGHHPLAPWGAPLLFAASAVIFGAWPAVWPTVLPMLLPVIGLAPWTGWITFEEWDLLVLAVAAGGYGRLALPHRSSRQASSSRVRSSSKTAWLVVALFTAALLVSMARGFNDAGGFTFGLFQGYREPMNSVRLAKSLFAALLLFPLWRAAQHSDSTGATRHLVNGLALGLLVTAAAATWERLAFTGLLDFSSDYRTTALFWEMHVGGAALDGMLSLTFPFVVRELMVAPSRWRWLLMASILLLGAYASLTTFSRAVYLSVPFGVAVMLAVHAAQFRNSQPWSLRREMATWLPAVVLVVAFAWGASMMFPTSGYRGLIALLGAAAMLLALPAALKGAPRASLWIGIGLGAIFSGVAWGIAQWVPKGAYWAYATAGVFTLTMLVLCQRPPGTRPARITPALALGGFVTMLAGIPLVARHWGGTPAVTAAWPVIAMLPLVLLAALATPSGLWPPGWRWQSGVGGAMLLAGGVMAAFGGGAYMTERFTTSSSDFGGRITHWRQGLSMLDTAGDLAFGRGLGRFVDNHAFTASVDRIPGDYRLRSDGDNRHLTLVGGTHVMGWGEMLRMSQRIPAPVGPMSVRLDARADQPTLIHLEICLKHLLYSDGCLVKLIRLPAKPGVWQTVTAQLDGKPLSTGDWYAPRLVMFSMATESRGQRVDIDNVALMGVDQTDVLVNGDFSAELSHWFMSSDRNHMPWHMKNIVAHVLFDQGLVGLALWCTLVAGALARVTLGTARGHPLAPGIAGGLAGFLIVGLFDSLLDVPRVAFLFYFVVLLGLTLKTPRPRPSASPAA